MDLFQESATFPSITMDSKVLLDMLLVKLNSIVSIARALNMHSHVRKLEFFVRHSEGNCFFPHQVSEMLKIACNEAEHVTEEYEIFTLRKQLLFPSSKTSKVQGLFSCRSNPIAYRIRLCLEIRKLVKDLDLICKFKEIRLTAPKPASVPYSGVSCIDIDSEDLNLALDGACEYSGVVKSGAVLSGGSGSDFVVFAGVAGSDIDSEDLKLDLSVVACEYSGVVKSGAVLSGGSGSDFADLSAVAGSDIDSEDLKLDLNVGCEYSGVVKSGVAGSDFADFSGVAGSDIDSDTPFGFPSDAHRHTPESVYYNGVVGRDIDRDTVIEVLLKSGNESTLFVFPIVGVGGIGKTTLAKLVFNDPRIVSHFQLRLYVHVSRVFKVEKVLEQIVNSVREDLCKNFAMNELQNLVQEMLHEKNYLIVLDDMWNEDPVKWDELKKSLMVGACGSKILATTRNEAVASAMGTVPAYYLKGLFSEDCLTLFLRKAFEQGQECKDRNIVEIASDLVQKCEGNPLFLMILGSSLHMETNEWKWNKVKYHDIWNSNQNDKISSVLRVSYDLLPSKLKVCLGYCSIFPKGCVFEIDKVIQLWIAEGLISKSTESEDREHIAIQYFQELLSRSFFQDVEEYRPVYTSVCNMHDLVHDLALSAAGVEFCTVNSHGQNISDEVRRVAFSDYDLSGKELPASLLNNRALRTISFSVGGVGPRSTMLVENCIARFMQLRVLDISDSCFDELPSSVGELKYLRYLDISSSDSIKKLPDSINKLLSLQTLRATRCPQLEGLPNDIGNLISLRYLHITTKQACFPDKAIGCLSSLHSLYIHSCKNLVSLSEGLQHLTNLRTLAIIDCPRLTFFPSAMKHLTALENLLIVDCEELTLLEWQDIEGLRMLRSLVIGGLPELKSKDVQCLGNLQMLVLAGLPQLVTLPRWLEGAGATLQYLRVERCWNFATLPKWLENLTALEKLEISKCCKSCSLPKGMSCLTNLKVLQIDN